MMEDIRAAEEAVQKLAGTYLKDIVTIQACTVIDVDKDNRTIDCETIGGDGFTDIPEVLLCAEKNNGLLVFPVVGSTVIVALTTRSAPFVLMFSDVESIQFMDGSYGSIPKIKDPEDPLSGILKRINDMENKINELVSFSLTHTHPYVNVVTPAVTSTTTTPVTGTLTLTTEQQISNEFITQGK